MPIFEYDCPDCGRFEVILLPSEKEIKVCPQCEKAGKKNNVTKAVSTAAFHLKGNGWYKTDYSSKNGTKSAKESDSKSSEKKSESATKSDTKTSGSGGCGSGCSCH